MTKQEAEKYAEQTALRLNEKIGGKWQTRVWDNLGWHCSVCLGSVTVSINENLPYNKKLIFGAYVGSEKNVASGALSMWHNSNNHGHETPEKAVELALMNAREMVLKLEENVSNNFDLMPLLRENMKRKLTRKRNYFLHG